MNSTFKVVFNKARGALMVVNEATSSVQAKGTKTVIAAAVTALMAGGAMAALPSDGVITNENLKEVGTTKLTSGMGQTVTIQTNGNVSQLIEDLKAVKGAQGNAKVAALRKAFGYDKVKNHSVMVGVTGGWNLMDETTAKIAALGLFTATQDAEVVKKFASQTGYKVDDTSNLTGGYLDQTNSFTSDRETSVIIGDVDGTSSPIVLGVVGGSNYLSVSKNNANIVQNAGSTVTINSGNVAGVVGGSLTVLSPYDISFNGEGTGAEEATRTQLFTSIESTALNIGGKANVGGFVAGHAGIATNGSKIDSEVKNGTTVNIKFNDEGLDPLDGLVVGGVAGNVVVATGKSEAKATTNGQTIVNIHNGEVMGIVGGGAAVSFDMGGTLGFLLGSGSGSATTQLQGCSCC